MKRRITNKVDEETSRTALTPKGFASRYGFSEGTLGNMRCQKEGPRFYKVGKKILYFVADIEVWIKKNAVLTKDDCELERG